MRTRHYAIATGLSRALQSGRGWGAQDRVRYLSDTAFDRSRQAFGGPVPAVEELATLPVFTEYTPAEPASASWLLPAGMLFRVSDEPVGPREALAAEAAWRERAPGALPDISSDSHPWEREAWSLLHQWRGAYFTEHGLHEQAAAAYRRSLDYIDSNGAIWYCLAGAHEELGSDQAAFQAYAHAILEAPALAGPRSNLAILLARAGRLAEAEQLLVEELGLDPDDEIAQANLTRVRRDLAVP